MSEEISDGIWVVRVWREEDDRSGLRARITATVGQGPPGPVSHDRPLVVTSVEQIECSLHEFLRSVAVGWSTQNNLIV
jgi:hypothetical protein